MPESQNIEWKESWRDECLKWICGLPNAPSTTGNPSGKGRGNK